MSFDIEQAFTDIANTVSHSCDFPVEVGQNDIWTYVKYNSGIVECWGETTLSFGTGTALSGATTIYYKTLTQTVPAGLFISADPVHVSAENSIGTIQASPITDNQFTVTATRFGNSNISQFRVSYRIKGYWKEFDPHYSFALDTGSVNSMLDYFALKNKVLWESTTAWTTGSKTIPNIDKYNTYLIYPYESLIPIIAFRKSDTVISGASFVQGVSSDTVHSSFDVVINLDGTTATLSKLRAINHVGTASHSTSSMLQVYKIVGLEPKLPATLQAIADGTQIPTTTLNPRGFSMEKIWENASLTNSFVNQAIALNLSSYDLVMILFVVLNTATDKILPPVFAQIGKGGSSFNYISDTSNRNQWRSFITSVTGVTFDDCYYNTANIPYQIYGVKGVV